MLDAVTKRRIDTARDILVGKVPDPKSQVEQITIALIYKFMNDIDAQSEEWGGERTFFAGEFAKYRWSRLVGPGVGGYDALNLYSESITRMPENPGVPQLFRNIFSNAYLPYRDPETLRAFLKVIDDFTYDDSESLGDAYEYLLSVLGVSADAGQFRTPRHIIDFIVAVVDPKKDEVILDPACGTAGFLISSYNHILMANTDDDGRVTLTPDERGRLVKNFNGYDISPDMVRLSLVNMYLHRFHEPNIHEYDTLTSEERWHEYADVILANPPFMNPKGGIRPHNRFSIKARRSEVLFVDYIAEHLNSNGRAGVIVPEGIIFQSQNAHKQLRKMLVEDYLVAVVSLPAGVFNPYSSVKTSILILDRALAKRTDSIAFFKVENDGLDLGAQRHPIDDNDLPKVQAELREYLARLQADEPETATLFTASGVAETKTIYTTNELAMGMVVEKSRIAEDVDFSLSGERYRESKHVQSNGWPLVALGEPGTFRVESGGTPKSSVKQYWDGEVPWITLVDLPPDDAVTEITSTKRTISEEGLRKSSAKLLPENSVVVSSRATIGRIGISRIPLATNQGFKNVVIEDTSKAMPEYVAHALRPLVPVMDAQASGATYKEIAKSKFSQLRIPLPPLSIQKGIVAEIEAYQKVIDGARAVVENYRPQIVVDPEWPELELGDCCRVKGGKRLPRGSQYEKSVTKHPYIRVSDFRDRSIDVDEVRYISESVHQQISRYTISCSDVYISIAGTIGMMGTIPKSLDGANLTENAAKLVVDPKVIDNRYLSIVGTGDFVQGQIRSLTHAVGVPKLALKRIAMLRVPVPPLKEQRKIIAEIEAEQAAVDVNRELIERFEKKIEAAIARVWEGKLTTDASG